MSNIIRVQRQRTAQWKTPIDEQGSKALYIGRGSVFGNPFKATKTRDAAKCKELYRYLICGSLFLMPQELYAIRRKVRQEVNHLEGRLVMCFCPTCAPCHGDLFAEWYQDGYWLYPPIQGINHASMLWMFWEGKSIASLAKLFDTTPEAIEEIIREYS